MANWFDFNGVRSTSLGVIMQTPPPVTLPEERATFEPIPGRSGSLTLLEGDAVYDDIVLSVDCYVRDLTTLDQIAAWLRGSGDLVLGNMPNRCYKARCVNQIELAKVLRGRQHRSFAAVFRCAPYRYVYPPIAGYALDVTVNTIADQAGSGTPSPSNVRPISGKASITVRRSVGKNLLPALPIGYVNPRTINGVTFTAQSDGSIRVQGTASAAINHAFAGAWNSQTPIFWLEPGTYTLSGGSANVRITLVEITSGFFMSQESPTTMNLSSARKITDVILRIASGTSVDTTIYPQLESGSTATTYEPYSGKTFTLTPSTQMLGLASAPDTIGSNGSVQHQTDAIVLDGSGDWWFNPGWTGNAYRLAGAIPQAQSISGYGTVADLMCSHFPAATPAAIADGALGIGIGNGTEIYVGFPDESVVPRQNLTAFKAWLAAHPVVLVYRLATPFDETVAPVEIFSPTSAPVVTSDGASVSWSAVAVESYALTAHNSVFNPGTADAAPVITVVGSGDITLTIGAKTVTITGLASAITIDCDAGISVNGATDLTGTVTMDYPVTLPPGENAISWTGTVTSVTISAPWRYI